MKPLVSVIIPAYNIQKYIANCIESVKAQTYKNIEIIVVDDGSTDDTARIVARCQRSDQRIRLISQDNQGVSSARNVGIELASGDYITFIDGDDLISVNAIEIMVDLATTGSQITCCGVQPTASMRPVSNSLLGAKAADGVTLTAERALEELLYERSINNGPIAKLFCSDLVKSLRFPPDISIAEDLYFNYLAISNSKTITVCKATVYFYLQRDGSAMLSDFSSKRMDGLAALERLNSNFHKTLDIERALQTRTFMEAMYNLVLIRKKESFAKEHKRCTIIAKKLAKNTLSNPKATRKNRAYALACVLFGPSRGSDLLYSALRIRGKKS